MHLIPNWPHQLRRRLFELSDGLNRADERIVECANVFRGNPVLQVLLAASLPNWVAI
jgi:hypothetical protein